MVQRIYYNEDLLMNGPIEDMNAFSHPVVSDPAGSPRAEVLKLFLPRYDGLPDFHFDHFETRCRISCVVSLQISKKDQEKSYQASQVPPEVSTLHQEFWN